MAAYLVRRLWQMIPTLLGVVLLVCKFVTVGTSGEATNASSALSVSDATLPAALVTEAVML